MRVLLLYLIYLILPELSLAQWESIGKVDTFFVRDGNQIELHSGKSVVRVSVLADDLIRVRASHDGVFNADRSVAVVRTDWPKVIPTVRNEGDRILVSTVEVVLSIGKYPLRLSFRDIEGRMINEDDSRGMAWDRREVRVWKKKPLDEYYFGLGEKAGILNRTFKSFSMWNSDIPAYKPDFDPLYQSVPFFYGIRNGKAYGIFFDNSSWSSFDLGKESFERCSFGALSGEIDYYFFHGPSPKKILSRFTDLVGRMPLPPRWSLGYQQCRWSYYPESRVRQLAKTFRDKKIPCDVIYLDIDYMEGYRIFTWSQKNFPDPKKMISDLAKDGFKLAVIVDPGIKADSSYQAYRSGMEKNVFLRYPDGRVYVGKVWPGECVFPDFSNPRARAWWGENFQVLVDAGVRGFWNDMNEPSVFDTPTKTVDLNVVHDDEGLNTTHAKNHNTYGMQMTQATYEGVRRLRPDERPFVLTRASYAGGHRYSAAWTGDNTSTWQDLQMAVPMCLGMSISGQPFVGTDIGGFIGSPDGELYTRWLQLGVFTPLMRSHTVMNSADQEPWSYGIKFEKINRETIELRQKFLPYTYSAMYQASVSGIPPMRPLLLEFPEDENNLWNDNEFAFGDGLLIAPVLWQGTTTRELRLPTGEWYEYWTDKKYRGGEQIKVDAPLNRIPIFAKAGAIIPTQQVVQYTDEAPIDPLTLTIYPAQTSSTTYYEDDGHSFAYENGVFLRRTIEQKRTGNSVRLHVSKTEGTYVPPRRSLVIEFVDTPSPRSVRFQERALPHVREIASSKEGWSYESRRKRVIVKVEDDISDRVISIE